LVRDGAAGEQELDRSMDMSWLGNGQDRGERQSAGEQEMGKRWT
jgi:hypothetical protein